MSFQLPGSNTQQNAGFSFGAPNTTAASVQPAAAKPGGFSFGATGGGDAGAAKPLGFGFGTTTPTAAPAATSVAATPVATASTGTPSFGLGGTGGTPTGFGFGTTPATASATATQQTSAPTFGATAAPQATTTGFGFGAAPAATQASTTTSAVGAPASNATAPLTSSFSFGGPTASTTITTPAPAATVATTAAASLTAAAAAAPTAATIAQPTATGGGFASLSTATKTTDSTSLPPNASQLSYNQLEEHINKWTLELEDQEKIFTDQATQINAWDKILISNNQKILDLNDAVQKVKSDQQTLEQELEFIATQHNELEESIVPLQKEFMKIPQVDVERSQTYLMVENLDTQLKQMSEDLKEIIDNLNESNKCQDNTDPIIQIGKILNAHMSSLQWIEQSTSSIGNKLEDITKMHETFKRDSERSFRSAYYN